MKSIRTKPRNHAAEGDERTPPASIKVVWCPVCGRTDRVTPLKPFPAKHHWLGKKCEGQPYVLTYEFSAGRP